MSITVKHEVLWQSAQGPINIRTMEDDHIFNCISVVQTKIKRFIDLVEFYEDQPEKFEVFSEKIIELEEWIDVFAVELVRRDEEDDHIERRPRNMGGLSLGNPCSEIRIRQ